MRTTTLAPEGELLLAAARLAVGTADDDEAVALLRGPLDWPSLVAQAHEEGLEGLAAQQLRRLADRHGLSLPLDVLAGAFRRLAAANTARLAELAAIGDALATRGVEAIVLKGGALIEMVYGAHPGLRPMGDLDLLVRESDLPAVTHALGERGYVRASRGTIVFDNGWSAIDVHIDVLGSARISRRRLAFALPTEALWRRASPLDARRPWLRALSPADQFLHVAIHGLKHSFSRLVWLVDLGLLGRLAEPETLLARARDTGCLRVLAYARVLLHDLFRLDVVPEADLPRPNWCEQRFLRAVVRRRRVALGELLAVFSIPGSAGRLSYLGELGFPSRAVLADVFPETPAWLRYPRRVVQLTALGVGLATRRRS